MRNSKSTLDQPHLIPLSIDTFGALDSINEALAGMDSTSNPLVRVFIDNTHSSTQNQELKIPMSEELPWSLVINDFHTIWSNYNIYLSPALDHLVNTYVYGEFYFELVLFAGEDADTPFGLHVDPKYMRSYHFQIEGEKNFVFDLAANIRFGEEISGCESNAENCLSLSSGQIGYLPTIYPHCASYKGVSVSIALAIWKRTIGEQVDFLIRQNEDVIESSFEEYKNAFFSKNTDIESRILSAIKHFSDRTIPRDLIEWFEK